MSLSKKEKEKLEELEKLKKQEKDENLSSSINQNKIYIPPIKMEAFLESETKQKLRVEKNRQDKRKELQDKEQRLKLNKEIERRYFRQEEQKDNFYDKYQNPMHDGDDILIDTRIFKENRDSFDPYNREETIYEEKSAYNSNDNEYKESSETIGKTKKVEVIVNRYPEERAEKEKRRKNNKDEKEEKTEKSKRVEKNEKKRNDFWDRERELER